MKVVELPISLDQFLHYKYIILIFQARHGKRYSATEEVKRKAIYAKTHAAIEAHNKKHAAGLASYSMAHNKLSDMVQQFLIVSS